MHLNTLRSFRQEVYGCFTRGQDALFNLLDALVSEPAARSLPELSLSPALERKWPSIYEALSDGRIDEERLQEVLVDFLPQPTAGQRLWLAIDGSSIARPDAVTSPGRSMIYVPNLPHARLPVSVGWQFSTVVALPERESSWCFLLAVQRMPASAVHQDSMSQVGIRQLRTLNALVKRALVVVADRWYSCSPMLHAAKEEGFALLVRVRSNRLFYARPDPERGRRGAPRKHGRKLQRSDPTSQEQPDEQWRGSDAGGKPVHLSAWRQMHPRLDAEVEGTVIRIVRPEAQGSKRDPVVSWFFLVSPFPIPLEEIAAGYRRRFSQEHTYRFLKQDLLWARPCMCTPEQFERWSWLVALAFDGLVLARALGQAHLHPWEQREGAPTPGQVRRVMPRLIARPGTPAPRPKVRGKAQGRAKGTRVGSAPRYEIIRKPKRVPKKRCKTA